MKTEEYYGPYQQVEMKILTCAKISPLTRKRLDEAIQNDKEFKRPLIFGLQLNEVLNPMIYFKELYRTKDNKLIITSKGYERLKHLEELSKN